MYNVLWVQTETGPSLWENGQTCSNECLKLVTVSDNVDYQLVESPYYKIFHNKYKHEIVVQGNLKEIDSLGRRIPFAFYLSSDNIHLAMEILDAALRNKDFSLLNEERRSIERNFIEQGFIPFLTKEKLKKWSFTSAAIFSFFLFVVCFIFFV